MELGGLCWNLGEQRSIEDGNEEEEVLEAAILEGGDPSGSCWCEGRGTEREWEQKYQHPMCLL